MIEESDDRDDRPQSHRRRADGESRRRMSRDDDDDQPRRRPRQERPVEATDFLIPTNVSGWSMAACYFGIFSCVTPILGPLMALIAFPCAIVALKRRKKAASYGAVTSDARAVIGLIASSLTIIGWIIVGVILLVNSTAK